MTTLAMKPEDVPGLFERVKASPITGETFNNHEDDFNKSKYETCVLGAFVLDKREIDEGIKALSAIGPDDIGQSFAELLGLPTPYCEGVIAGWDGSEFDWRYSVTHPHYEAGYCFGKASWTAVFCR